MGWFDFAAEAAPSCEQQNGTVYHPRLLSDAYANFASTCANRDPQNSRTRGVWSFSWRIMPLSAQKQRERRAAQRAAEAQQGLCFGARTLISANLF